MEEKESKSMHGGYRQGAGRKPILSIIQRIDVGLRCEELSQEGIKNDTLNKAFKSLPEDPRCYEGRNLLSDIKNLKGKDRINYINALLKLKPNSVSEKENDLIIDFNDAAPKEKRYFNTPIKRQYRRRREILCAVQNQIQKKLNLKKISLKTINNCWIEFRRKFFR